jgi:hypothetical protein
MDSEFEDEEAREYKPFSWSNVIKAMAILFVMLVYTVIFLKILFLE